METKGILYVSRSHRILDVQYKSYSTQYIPCYLLSYQGILYLNFVLYSVFNIAHFILLQ